MSKRRTAIVVFLIALVAVLVPLVFQPRGTLYVHLTNDGGIMVLPDDRLETRWITPAELDRELDRVRDAHGTVLYSRERPETEPSAFVRRTFARITSTGASIRLVTIPHPDAGKGRPVAQRTTYERGSAQ